MKKQLSIACGAALCLAACATVPPPNPTLESARAAVQSAEADPNVNKYAPLELSSARGELNAAEEANSHRNYALTDQAAYLATQKARIAEAHAAAKADDARVAAGQAERDQIMLAARTREAERAKQSAADSRAEATVALAERDQAAAQRDQANAENARVQAELDALKATPTPRGIVMTLGDVLFDTGHAELKSGAGRKLDQLAQFLMEHPERKLQVDGFTDSVGSDAYNEDLSQRRADAVKTALVSRGVDASRIGTMGYGKAYPVASNDESGGRQLNRRVEVIIGGANGAAVARR